MVDFFFHEQAKSRIHRCGLCEAGNQPTQVVHIPAVERLQVRFPRSKKKRIRKKWAKRQSNYIDRYVTMVLEKKSKVFKAIYGSGDEAGNSTV